MLTANLTRSRTTDETVTPLFIDPAAEQYRETARELIRLFEAHLNEPKGELEDAIDQLTVADTDYKIVQGLAKLLTDECDFEVITPADPQEIRRRLFERTVSTPSFDSQRLVRTPRNWTSTARSPTISVSRWKRATKECTQI